MSKQHEETIIRRVDGSVDAAYYLRRAAKLRNAALRQAAGDFLRRVSSLGRPAGQLFLRWLGTRMHMVR